jgi:hypothetical protein
VIDNPYSEYNLAVARSKMLGKLSGAGVYIPAPGLFGWLFRVLNIRYGWVRIAPDYVIF